MMKGLHRGARALVIGFVLLLTGQSVAGECIWVQREGYHTAILVESALVVRVAPELEPLTEGMPYVRFGWGDRRFYGADRRHAGHALKALLLPTRSVMEVVGFAAPDKSGGKLLEVPVTGEEADAVMMFMADSFRLSGSGKPRLERTSKSGARYYRAKRRYHLLWNCNNWTSRSVRNAGTRVPYLSSILARPLMRALARRGEPLPGDERLLVQQSDADGTSG